MVNSLKRKRRVRYVKKPLWRAWSVTDMVKRSLFLIGIPGNRLLFLWKKLRNRVCYLKKMAVSVSKSSFLYRKKKLNRLGPTTHEPMGQKLTSHLGLLLPFAQAGTKLHCRRWRCFAWSCSYAKNFQDSIHSAILPVEITHTWSKLLCWWIK